MSECVCVNGVGGWMGIDCIIAAAIPASLKADLTPPSSNLSLILDHATSWVAGGSGGGGGVALNHSLPHASDVTQVHMLPLLLKATAASRDR